MSLLDQVKKWTRRNRGKTLRLRDPMEFHTHVCKRCGFMVKLKGYPRGVDIPAEVGCLRCDVGLVRQAMGRWGGCGVIPHDFLVDETGLPSPRATRAVMAIIEGRRL